MHPYPTLSLLDRVRGADHRSFADDPDAFALERRARQLVDEYWGDRVWLTGRVSAAAFTTVCEALERERAASAPAVVVVLTTVPASVAPPALAFSRPPEAASGVIAAS